MKDRHIIVIEKNKPIISYPFWNNRRHIENLALVEKHSEVSTYNCLLKRDTHI